MMVVCKATHHKGGLRLRGSEGPFHHYYSQAYEAMPIEEFGMAMLRGMGWKEGMGVGRNRKVGVGSDHPPPLVSSFTCCGSLCRLSMPSSTLSDQSVLGWALRRLWVPQGPRSSRRWVRGCISSMGAASCFLVHCYKPVLPPYQEISLKLGVKIWF